MYLPFAEYEYAVLRTFALSAGAQEALSISRPYSGSFLRNVPYSAGVRPLTAFLDEANLIATAAP